MSRAPVLPMLIYLIIAIMGYLSCGSFTPDIIINRSVKDPSKDIYMTLG